LAQNKSFLRSHLKLNLVLAVLGILIAIFFGIYGVYSTYQENKSEISFKIINEANVLDVHEPLSDLTISFQGEDIHLTISFQGEDIQEKNLNLRIITVRIENSGSVNILQSHYDINDIWGIQVKNGEIIRANLIDSNSEYLKSNLKLGFSNETIEFTKTIFEKGKYFTIEILVFHKKDKSPEMFPIGKIAGIEKMEKMVPIRLSDEKEETFISRLFYGDLLINIVRFIFFVSLAILLVVLIGVSADKINESKEKRLRKNIFNSTVAKSGVKFFGARQYDVLKKLYVKLGYRIISQLIHIFKNPEKLLNIIDEVKYNEPLDFNELADRIRKNYRIHHVVSTEGVKLRGAPDVDFALINYLYKNGVIRIEDDRIFPDSSEVLQFLQQFPKRHRRLAHFR
jgi:hypothetical protein